MLRRPGKRFFRGLIPWLIIALPLIALACGGDNDSPGTAGEEDAAPGDTTSAQSTDEGQAEQLDLVGSFEIEPPSGTIGSTVVATGSGFDPGVELELVWNGFKGSWLVDGGNFLGREYAPDPVVLATIETDSEGTFEAPFAVPEGFGFGHDVVVRQDGVARNQARFEVEMEAAIEPSSGPVGTPITLNVRGIGQEALENSWMVIYDNKFTGWLSAVTTNGYATATLPATGGPGTHVIQILHGSFTFPYMNMQQSPSPDRPTFTMEFEITEGAPVLPPAPASQAHPQEFGSEPEGSDSAIWLDITSGNVGDEVTLRGRSLDGDSVDVVWRTMRGNRVSGSGYEEVEMPLGTVSVESGSFEFAFVVPADVGGAHRIEAVANSEVLAETEFMLKPRAISVENASGPAGTTATLHIDGVGWSETANIYTVVYDNNYVGYSCGFNTRGDVVINLPIAGEPGYHFIDLYPAIYKGEDISRVNNFRIPQLTYADDHPGEDFPAFRFAVFVEGDGSASIVRQP